MAFIKAGCLLVYQAVLQDENQISSSNGAANFFQNSFPVYRLHSPRANVVSPANSFCCPDLLDLVDFRVVQTFHKSLR